MLCWGELSPGGVSGILAAGARPRRAGGREGRCVVCTLGKDTACHCHRQQVFECQQPKGCTDKLSKLISNLQGHKGNLQKSVSSQKQNETSERPHLEKEIRSVVVTGGVGWQASRHNRAAIR